jgi:hypothetical protein
MMRTSSKLLIIATIFFFLAGTLFGFEFKIAKVGPNYVMATLKVRDGEKPPKLDILQVYDVFEKMEIIDGKRVFINYIDSVYLKEVKKEELYFAFIWEGEGRILQENYILTSTERYYTFHNIPFEQISDEPEVTLDEGTGDKEPGTLPTPPVFAYIILSGYTLLHNINYSSSGSQNPPFMPGYLTADFLLFLPWDLGFRFTCATRHTFDHIYLQATGINYRGVINSFLKFYTEIGAGYPIPLSGGDLADSSVIIVAQYGLLFDFRAVAEWGFFAIDLYVNANFPVNTILEGMYINYGLKAGVRF